ncbi:hypothetical protein SKAU_G00300960 [Synaphobranchus kaupii]|uniref:Sterile alpha motif domain-containing protein 9-like n=1 Tax=Synaphobranchus kaupii TaxID=118154 RepID=A0A9Q1EVP9_SYNKA|nr:hypothetical protein SKAU_G00300960 [Synaphobranchus kaupii]
MQSDHYIPNSGQGRTNMDSSLRNSLPSLEILYANQCETSPVPKDLATSTEAYFYHGGQVQWLNFFLAEKKAGPGSPAGLSFIKRDGYRSVAQQVDRQRQSRLSISSVHLLHQPGSGGTTLAMQVLWDFRKKLRCAVLRDSEAQVQHIARQTIALFQAGGPENNTTVLLLIDNLPKADTLERGLVQCVASSRVHGKVPVVIILNCKRVVGGNGQSRTDIACRTELSYREKEQFIERESVLLFRGQQSERFYGFNIMRRGFSEDYVREVIIPIMDGVQRAAKSTKLLAVLALLNSYVPGSSLLKAECQAFLGPPDPIHGGPSFEDRMEPFTGLLVTFSRQENLVRMAHPLIATYCCRALEAAGLSLGETTKTLVKHFDKKHRDKSLALTISNLLVNRTTGKQFSPLIEDLRERKPRDCVTILELVCKEFPCNAFIRQALARFLYLSNLQDYSQAEKWARKAVRIMPNNSFIADTLGQLHKHHLQWKKPDSLCMELELVQKAVAAFEAQWKVAEEEDEVGQEDAGGTTWMSYFFNSSGMFGYIQVAKIIIDIFQRPKVREPVLMLNAKDELPCRSIASNNFQTFLKFKTLLASFKDKVETTFRFFECFLTYSERDKDQSYMRKNVTEICYCWYVTLGKESPRQGADGIREELKERTAASFPGLLHCLEMNKGMQEMTEITKMWKEVAHTPSPAHSLTDTLCYLLSNIALSCVHPVSPDILPFSELTSTLQRLLREERRQDREPELYFLALVSLWPGAADNIRSMDINNYVTRLQKAYEQSYQKHLRSRYIRAHFFLREGTEYSRLVHWSTVKRRLLANAKDDTQRSRAFHQWRDQADWENTELLRVQGVVKDREMFACYGQREVLVHPDNMAQVRSPGRVTFYLGFNIRGPVAFDIQYSSGPVQHPS